VKLALVAAFVLALATPAFAQHSHGEKGPNGGPVEDIAGIHAELMTSGTTITLNILDESMKPVATKGFSASALVASGAARETVRLTPSGESALKGDAKTAISAGTTITVTLKTAAGKSGQARFKP
jgi:hypothetical protein